MKRIIFLVVFSVLSTSIHAQSKKTNSKKEPTVEETKKWIEQVIKEYGYGTIKFEDNLLKYDIPSYPGTHTVYNQTVTLSELSMAEKGSGSVVEGKTWLHLVCLNSKCVNVDTKRYEFDTNRFQITLNESISEDMKDRLIKAFNHLIKQYTKSKISNTF